MKNFKKILALLLALMMTVTVLSACADKKDGEEKDAKTETVEEQKVSAEDEVKKIAEDYVTATLKGDDSALDFVDEDSDYYEEAEEAVEGMKTAKDSVSEIVEEMGLTGEYATKAEEMMGDLFDQMLDMISVEVKECEVDGDKATVEIVAAMPDFAALGDVVNEDALTELYTEEELAEIEEKAAALSGEELEAFQGELILEVLEKGIEYGLDNIDKDAMEEEATVELEKISDDWKIVSFE